MSRGVGLGLLGRVGELHAAGLHAAARQHLRLDHGGRADLRGDRPRLLRRAREAVRRGRGSRPRDDLAGLVLEEAHGGPRTLTRAARSRLPPVRRRAPSQHAPRSCRRGRGTAGVRSVRARCRPAAGTGQALVRRSRAEPLRDRAGPTTLPRDARAATRR